MKYTITVIKHSRGNGFELRLEEAGEFDASMAEHLINHLLRNSTIHLVEVKMWETRRLQNA